MLIDKRTYTIEGIEYTAAIGYGAQLYSKEETYLPPGTCRVILDRIFYVYRIGRTSLFGKKYEISWGMASPKFDTTVEQLDLLRKDICRA